MPLRRKSRVRAGVPANVITLALYWGLAARLMFWKLAANVPLSMMTFSPAIALLNEPEEIMASPETSTPAAQAGPTTMDTAPPAAVRFVVRATPSRFDRARVGTV